MLKNSLTRLPKETYGIIPRFIQKSGSYKEESDLGLNLSRDKFVKNITELYHV